MSVRSLILICSLSAVSAFAQDPPARVARLNWIQGNVSFQPAGVDDWTAATVNYPLTTGDHIYTDVGSRTEMHVGPNALRLNGQSNFGFLNLDDRTVQVRFTEGALEVRLRQLDDGDLYEVDTPQGAISLLRTGDYRIDTDPDRNATMVTVWSGEVEVTAGGNSFAVHPRETAYFDNGGAPDVRSANPPDDFDNFVASRNEGEDRVPPPVHVPPTMAGYEDLDAYGTWRQAPDYGWVWAPRVEAGWVPYQRGHWAWVEPWGWTWIDDAPWGFAPFHYGRWAFVGTGWVWVPGAIVARPVYAPALVAFVGGPGFSVSVGFGAGTVAWFPLGPREPYYPAYHVSTTYIQQVNITHVTNINVTNVNVTNIRYVNQQVPGAVIAAPQTAFIGARPVAGVARPLNRAEIVQVRVVGAAPSVVPVRESVLAGGRLAVARPSQAVMTRAVVARATPPPPPVSFEGKQEMLRANQGRPLDAQQINEARRQDPRAVMSRALIRAASGPIAPIPPAPPQNRLDSRPPSARPLSAPAPENRPIPAVARPAFEPRPAPEPRPAAEPRRAPEARPAPEVRERPAPAAREDRPRPRRDQREEKDKDKK